MLWKLWKQLSLHVTDSYRLRLLFSSLIVVVWTRFITATALTLVLYVRSNLDLMTRSDVHLTL